jgi:hypothetical protein
MSIYAYSEFMDRNPYAPIFEIIKSVFGIGLIYTTGDWFALDTVLTNGKYIVVAGLFLTAVVTFAIDRQDRGLVVA